jgi:hypothetical protein
MTRQLPAPITNLSLTPYNRMAVDLYRQVKSGKVLLDPPYQRGSVWTTDQRMDLMYSYLSGYPIGAAIFNDRMRGDWGYKVAYAVIDGRQRLETIVAWFDGQLAVPASWFESQYLRTGRVFADYGDGPYVDISDLTERGADKVESLMVLPVVVASVGDLASEADIYRLVNAGGTPHTPDDLARAAEVEAGQSRDQAAG